MPLNPNYQDKFQTFKKKTHFEQLEIHEQEFLRNLAFQNQFTFQEFRQVVEASRDLAMWKEEALPSWWKKQPKKDKKKLLQDLQKFLISLKTLPKYYSPEGLPKPSERSGKKIFKKESSKEIYGMCPVASEKTVCCNLKTIDAVEGCSFGCSYCSIQTFYNDSFAFDANFAEKLKKIPIDPSKFYHFGTGQASDSLAWGNLNNNLTSLCDFAKKNPNILLEFKTKSKNISYFLENEIPSNVVCSWSLNTPTIIQNEEHFTANLEKRLASARSVADQGILVAFHFHPMVYYSDWEKDYLSISAQVQKKFLPHEVAFISMGSVTFIKPVIQKIRNLGNPTKILQMELVKDPHGKMTYPDAVKAEMFSKMYKEFNSWHKEVFFYLCMEKESIWKKTLGFVYPNNETFEKEFGRQVMPKSQPLPHQSEGSSLLTGDSDRV